MLTRSPELEAYALAVANTYAPVHPPLLAGSTYWLGAGKDMDVVVLVTEYRTGHEGSTDYPDTDFHSYRHGDINIIATTEPRVWHGWRYACLNIGAVPTIKTSRISHVMNLREEGERQYAQAASQ